MKSLRYGYEAFRPDYPGLDHLSRPIITLHEDHEPGPVSLLFYNALGQRVLELPLGSRGAGFHRVGVEPNLGPGIYFYRLMAGERLSGFRAMVIR